MKILPLFVLLACVAFAFAQDDETKPAAPSRGLLKRGPLAKAKQTTTTTTSAPQEEAEYEDDEYAEVATEAPVSSTEGKKLVAGAVRPFRSNTDLLETLKRRRAQAAEAKLHGSASATTSAVSQDATAEAKSTYSKKRVSNTAAREVNNEEAPPAPKSGRGRFGRTSSRSIPESELEEIESAPARNSRFSRRGGN